VSVTEAPGAGGCRRAAGAGIIAAVAAIHVFGAGRALHGELYRLYYSYASDILVPLAAYFVLCMSDRNWKVFRSSQAKAISVLGAASVAEVLQRVGVPLLGRTFDPLDFLMYGAGVSIAVLLDRCALEVLCR